MMAESYYAEIDEGDWDELYAMLGEGGEPWVLLTEPEDRVWYRDLAPVVARLNEQHARIATLEREHAELLEVARPSGLIAQLQEEQGGHECPACSYRWIDPQNLKDHYQGEHA